MGIKTAPFVVPLALTLFLFILIANWIAIVPTGHHPEYVAAAGVGRQPHLRARASSSSARCMSPASARTGCAVLRATCSASRTLLIPLNIIEEVMKPITLALRLFGNIFSGTIMVVADRRAARLVLWAPDIIWKLFDAFIGLIQAFIFGLLTVLYFSSVAPAEEGAAALSRLRESLRDRSTARSQPRPST